MPTPSAAFPSPVDMLIDLSYELDVALSRCPENIKRVWQMNEATLDKLLANANIQRWVVDPNAKDNRIIGLPVELLPSLPDGTIRIVAYVETTSPL